MTPQAQQEDLLIIKVSLRTSVDILEKLVWVAQQIGLLRFHMEDPTTQNQNTWRKSGETLTNVIP
jgi:hypothetical protein